MASTHSRNSIRRAVAVLVVLLIGIGGSGYTHVNDKNGRKLKTEGAQVYANDDQSSGVVYTLEPGDEYQLLDVDEQWCRIRVEKDDVEGYALVIELDLDVDEILAALNETEDEAETLAEQVRAQFPDCEVELNDGGQPIYYYLLSVE